MPFPTLANFTRRMGNSVAGQLRYIETEDVTEWNRTSLLSPTSAPVEVGQVVAYSTTPATIQPEGQAVVTAVVGGFTAAQFAGFVPFYEIESQDRAIVDLNSTVITRNGTTNIKRHAPGEYFARSVSPKPRWIETSLTVAPAAGAVVQVLTGGIVNTAGGVAVPAVFCGELRTDAINGKRYATVQLTAPLPV